MAERMYATYDPSQESKELLVRAKKRTIVKHKKIIERLRDDIDAL